MTIIDDLRAINKDIARPDEFNSQMNRANYWKIKLENIYPDYYFVIIGADDFNVKIVASVKGVE